MLTSKTVMVSLDNHRIGLFANQENSVKYVDCRLIHGLRTPSEFFPQRFWPVKQIDLINCWVFEVFIEALSAPFFVTVDFSQKS